MQIDAKLTDEQEECLEALIDLLSYGYPILTDDSVSMDGRTLRTRVSHLLILSLHSYVEAVWRLLKEGKVNAAAAVFRVVMEAFVNLEYIHACTGNANAIKYVLDDEFERRRLGDQLLKLLGSKPQLATTNKDDLSNPAILQTVINDVDAKIAKARRLHPKVTTQLPSSLVSMIQEIETWKVGRNAKHLVGSQELTHRKIYWHYSNYSHASSRATSSIYRITNGQQFIDMGGDPTLIEGMAVHSYGMYLQLLIWFNAIFHTRKQSSLKPYKQRFKKLGERLA